jgi:erythromycin esterase
LLSAQSINYTQRIGVTKLWKESIKKYVKPITNLESADYSDLTFLDSLLIDKKYIFIGESSHEVSEFYKLKLRLIKYLHYKLGFNVIAFEENMGICSYFNEIKTQLSIINQQRVLFDSDGRCTETLDLIKYLDSTNISVTGFDVQITSLAIFYSIIRKHFCKFPESLIKEDSLLLSISDANNQPDTLNEIERKIEIDNWRKEIVNLVCSWEDILKDSSIFGEKNRTTILLKKSIQERTSWLKLIPNISPECRDSVMAANLVWMIRELFPNEKIIIWAHNEHIAKKSDSFHNMGSMLPDSISEKSYVLGLYAYQGYSGVYGSSVKLVKNKRNSLGAIINSANYEISFCDFSNQSRDKQNLWMFKKMKTISWAFQRPIIIPAVYYDGIIQIKDISPQHLIGQ